MVKFRFIPIKISKDKERLIHPCRIKNLKILTDKIIIYLDGEVIESKKEWYLYPVWVSLLTTIKTIFEV